MFGRRPLVQERAAFLRRVLPSVTGRMPGRGSPMPGRGSPWLGHGCRAGLAVVAVLAVSAGRCEEPAAAVQDRNVIRKQLPRGVRSIALEYTLLAVDDSGRERPIDPQQHIFAIGDSFVVRIVPQDDVYVYVFNEGPTGDRVCLLPATDAAAPLVKRGEEVTLPDDGGFFTLAAPPGEEKLMVVALSERSDDLALLTRHVFRAQRDEAGRLTSEQAAARKEADAGVEALRQRNAGDVLSRGPVRRVVERVETGLGPAGRLTHVEPPGPGQASSYGIAVSSGTPELFLDIPLRSK